MAIAEQENDTQVAQDLEQQAYKEDERIAHAAKATIAREIVSVNKSNWRSQYDGDYHVRTLKTLERLGKLDESDMRDETGSPKIIPLDYEGKTDHQKNNVK